MVLDDTTALAELVDGAVAAAIGATGATVAYSRRAVRFAPRLAWARHGWRPLMQYGPDLYRLLVVLARALRSGARDAGEMRQVPFTLEPDAPARNAQVALASVAGSFAPNTIVVSVDEHGGTILVHQLLPPSPPDRLTADPLELG